MKDNEYLYVESQIHTLEPKRIVRMPDNSLVIFNASVADSSNNYKCSILRKPDPIDLIHRVLVDEIYQETPPPQHSHKGIIRVIPSKKVEVNLGQVLKLGCETNIQPPPEIKWFVKVCVCVCETSLEISLITLISSLSYHVCLSL